MCQCWDEQGKCEAGIECGICSCRLCGRRRWMLVLLTHWQCNVCAPPPPTDHSPHTGRPGASQTTHWVWDNQFSFYHYRQYYHVTKTLWFPSPEGRRTTLCQLSVSVFAQCAALCALRALLSPHHQSLSDTRPVKTCAQELRDQNREWHCKVRSQQAWYYEEDADIIKSDSWPPINNSQWSCI